MTDHPHTLRFSHQIGVLHFVGIGGIGMSGIAELLFNLGYQVQGSDIAENANVKRLRDLGISVMIGQREENVANAGVLIVSTAIKRDNPELRAARHALIPVVRRAEMLGELMRLRQSIAIAGTHGKTTTTTMVATLLDGAEWDPTVVNGGIINAFGSNARLGGGDWMVVEADESDGSFLRLPADVALVTNIDPEHLDHYGSFDRVLEAFRSFIERLPFYGFAVMCLDHPVVQDLIGTIQDRRIITYGTNPQADIVLENFESSANGSRFSLRMQERRRGEAEVIDDLALPMPGKHNALNAAGAIGLVYTLGMEPGTIRKALSSFRGVKRRFTHIGEVEGVDIYDDYGHHPVELRAVLSGARSIAKGRIIAVFQPHRFSRLKDLFEDFCQAFNDADMAVIAPVFAAGEEPIEGIDGKALAAGLRAHGHRSVTLIEGEDDLAPLVGTNTAPGDMVVCLGAGSITLWAHNLPEKLKALPRGN